MATRNQSDKNNYSMLWMMLPCLFLVGFLFFGGEKLSSSGYLWPVLIGVFVVAHVWMMFKGRGCHKDDDREDKSNAILEKQPDAKNEHKHGGCGH